jgi:hypothetical protein
MENNYTNAVGENKKFNQHGEFQTYPGNTIVCNLSGQPEVLETILWIQNEHKTKLPFVHKFAWTPVESFHMTVFELLCHYNRKETHWSSKLATDAPLEETDRFFARALESVSFPERFTMRVEKISKTSIVLSPHDESVANLLNTFRDQVSGLTGVRFPNHDTYKYHITFGYQLIKISPEEEALLAELQHDISKIVAERMNAIVMDTTDYTVFKDMTRFIPYEENARHYTAK